MSVRMRHTRGHTNNRRSHHALSATVAVVDKESGSLRLPHRVDETTGKYRGKQIFVIKAKRVHESKVKGPATKVAVEHKHEHAQEVHASAEVKSSKGIFGRFGIGGKPKARSGFGGGA